MNTRFESMLMRQGFIKEILTWLCFALLETVMWTVTFLQTEKGKILTYVYHTGEDDHIYYKSVLRDCSKEMLFVFAGFLVLQLVFLIFSYRHKYNWGRILYPVWTLMNFGLLLQLSYGSGFVSQFIHYVVGLALMAAFCVISCAEPGRRGFLLTVAFLFLLCISNLLFGTRINGSKAWIILPVIHLSIQPGEFLKVLDILLVSIGYERLRNDRKVRLAYIAGFLAQILLLLFAVQDTGNALVIVLLGIFCMLAFNIADTIFLTFSCALLSGAALYIFSIFSASVREKISAILSRFTLINTVLLDPEAESNFRTMMLSVVRAGLKGTGFKNWEYSWEMNTVASNSDYASLAIAAIGGVTGIAVILTALCVLVRNADSDRSTLSASQYLSGKLAAIVLVLHAGINIGAATNIGPLTGTTLPFVSAGGSAIAADSMLIGILLGNCLPQERRILWAKRIHRLMNPFVDSVAEHTDALNLTVKERAAKGKAIFLDSLRVPYTEEELQEQDEWDEEDTDIDYDPELYFEDDSETYEEDADDWE